MTPAWLSARCFSQQLRFVMLECNTWLKQLESRSKASVLWIRPGGGCRNSQKLLSLRWRRVLCTPPPLLLLERGVPQVSESGTPSGLRGTLNELEYGKMSIFQNGEKNHSESNESRNIDFHCQTMMNSVQFSASMNIEMA